MRSATILLFCVLGLIGIFPTDAVADWGPDAPVSTWVGPDGGLWSDPTNWSPVGAPTDQDNVSISTVTPISIVADIDYSANVGFFRLTSLGPVTLSGTSATVQCYQGFVAGATFESGNYLFWNGTLTDCVLRGGRITSYSGIGLSNVDVEPGSTIDQGPAGRVEIDGVVNMDGGSILCEDTGAWVSATGILNLNKSGIGAVDFTDTGVVNNYGGQNVQGFFSMSGKTSQRAIYNDFSGFGVSAYFEGGGDSLYIGDYSVFNQFGDVGVEPWDGGYGDSPGYQHEMDIGGATGSAFYHKFSGTLSVPDLNVGTDLGPGILEQDAGATSAINTDISAGAVLDIYGGSFTGPISNSGLLKINSSVVLAISQLDELSSAELDLTGLAPSAAAMIATTQDSSLAGELAIQLANGYVPVAGDVFDLIDSPSLSGTFDSYDLPVLPNDLQWKAVHTPANFSLIIVPEPATMALGIFAAALFIPRRRATRNRM